MAAVPVFQAELGKAKIKEIDETKDGEQEKENAAGDKGGCLLSNQCKL